MAHGAEQQKLAVDSGVWPLYRFDPRRVAAGRAAAAARLRRRPRPRVARVHAERDPLPHGREAGPRALQAARSAAAERDAGAARTPSTSSSPASPCRGGAPRSAAAESKEDDHGPLHDLPRLRRCRIRSCPAPRRWSTTSTSSPARGRRRGGDRDALAVRGADRARADARLPRTSSATASRFAEALSLLPEPRRASPSGRTSTCEQIRRIKAAVARAGDRLAQRHHGGRLARLRPADRAGGRRRPGAERLRARRPTSTRAAQDDRGPHGRDGARRSSESVAHPGGGQAVALLHSLAHFARRLDEAGADGLVLFNRFYQPDIDVEDAGGARATLHLSDSSELLLRLRWLAILSGASAPRWR